jgi:hypothetical protein
MKTLKFILLSTSITLTFTSHALDIQGLDRFGYTKNGFDNKGYNFFGYNKKGINRQGCNVYKYKNDKTLNCNIDVFAEKAKNEPEFLAYQLRRSKEILYTKQ